MKNKFCDSRFLILELGLIIVMLSLFPIIVLKNKKWKTAGWVGLGLGSLAVIAVYVFTLTKRGQKWCRSQSKSNDKWAEEFAYQIFMIEKTADELGRPLTDAELDQINILEEQIRELGYQYTPQGDDVFLMPV